MSVSRTGHLHGTDVLKLSLVSKDVGVCTPGSCSSRQLSPIRIRIEDTPSWSHTHLGALPVSWALCEALCCVC